MRLFEEVRGGSDSACMLRAVVGLDGQDVDVEEVFDELARDAAEVGREAEAGVAVVGEVDAEGGAAQRVVGAEDRAHPDAGGEVEGGVEADHAGGGVGPPCANGFLLVGGVDAQAGVGGQATLPGGAAVVGVEVGQKDVVDLIGAQAALGQEADGAPRRDAGVDEAEPYDAAAFDGEHGAVSARAAGEDAQVGPVGAGQDRIVHDACP